MILVFGSINIDLTTRVRDIPRPGETVLSDRYETGFGGKGANQAVAAARGRQDPGCAVWMAGAVGDDAFGRAAVDNLQAQGVDTHAVRQATGWPTGCAFITVSAAGENAITVASGANLAPRAADVPAEMLNAARLIVLQMEVPPAESLTVAERARAQGARVVLNLAPAPEAAQASLLPALLAAADILIANEHETLSALRLLEGAAPPDPVAAMARLARYCAGAGIVTLGAGGAVAFPHSGESIRATVPPVEPVDTTGAGDTFVGLLAVGLAEGRALAPALRRACHGASLACQVPGAQAGMPRAADLPED